MRKFFIVAALIMSSQLFAQITSQRINDSLTIITIHESRYPPALDPVTVTATKYSIKTTETGKVVDVITKEDIGHAGSRDLAQVITELGGVFINGFNSNLGKEKNIYLRGAKVDYTLITIDGVPVYDASGIGSNFDIRNISIDNIERIEILKGSQSTLYGSDAIAGVINIITKKGGTKPFSVNGVADYGSFNTFRGNLNMNGLQKGFEYNIGYSHVNTDGFSEAKKPANSTDVFDKDGYHQNSVNANFGLQTGKFIRIQPFFRYTNYKGDLDQDAFVDEKDFTNTNKNLEAGVHNVVKIGKGQVNVQYQFINTRRFYLDDSTKSRNGFYTYNSQAYNAHEHFAEAFFVYSINKIKLTAGSDFRSSNTNYNAVQVDPYGGIPTPLGNDSVKQHQFGAYAALNYSSNNFNIEGGGRWNHHSEYGSNFAFNINPSYFIDKKVKVFANLSSGYKTPSLYQLFSLYGNKTLKPENSLNAEGGLQVFTKNERSSLRVDYFNRNIKDVISFVSIPIDPYGQYINQDKQKDHGLEAEVNSKLSDKIQWKAIYSYVTGKVATKQNGKDTIFFNLLRRPKRTFNFFIGSQLTKTLYVNAQLDAIGERKDVYYPPTFIPESITLKSYALVNFYVEYSFLNNRLKIFADMRNIFDKNYSDIYGYNTAGFNAYGGIRFHF